MQRLPDGAFDGSPIAGSDAGRLQRLSGDEQVSMNLWGFAESILDELDSALDAFDPETAPHDEGKPPELLLPDVVGRVVAEARARFRVVPSNSRCIGLTHPDDLPLGALARRRRASRLRRPMTRTRRLVLALVVDLILVAAEATGGVFAHSTGLVATAGHDLADAAALGLALVATRLASATCHRL